jgi:hypothetical protein
MQAFYSKSAKTLAPLQALDTLFCRIQFADRTPMVKCGSTCLYRVLMQAARLAAVHCETFSRYMAMKQAQGKHYFVAFGHTTQKLINVIFRILTFNEIFASHA